MIRYIYWLLVKIFYYPWMSLFKIHHDKIQSKYERIFPQSTVSDTG